MPLYEPKNTGYQRPADWLPLPTVTDTDRKFVGLHAINEHANFCALQCTGAYTVDWGDGTIEDFASTVIAYHQYNYATYDVANATLCSRGYKQAIVTVTPQAASTITVFNLKIKHNQAGLVDGYSSGWLDIALSLPNLSASGLVISTSAVTVQHSLLEQAKLENIGGTTSLLGLFYACSSLVSLYIKKTVNITTTFSMFAYCYALQTVPFFDTSNVTTTTSMFFRCFILSKLPLFDMSKVTTASSMLNSCTLLQSISALNLTSVTTTTDMFLGCSSVYKASFINMKETFSIANCKLSATALNEIYTNLATVVGKTITVTGNYGTATDDPTIATAKGWTVTG